MIVFTVKGTRQEVEAELKTRNIAPIMLTDKPNYVEIMVLGTKENGVKVVAWSSDSAKKAPLPTGTLLHYALSPQDLY